MAASRYMNSSKVPQAIKKILPAPTDIIDSLKYGERVDNKAQKFYGDPTLSWVIMLANPEWENEWVIPFGTELRIPFPLQRVFDNWLISNEI